MSNLTPYVYLFAFFGLVVTLIGMLGGILAWLDWRGEQFKFEPGHKVSVSHGHPLLQNWYLTNHVVVARYASWYGARWYLITGPEYLDGAPPGQVYPIEIKPEKELHGGWH